MSALARALLDDLEPDDLAALAERLRPFLPAPVADDGWIDAKAAATHLGVPVSTIHRMTAARSIPFQQAKPGAKCWFRRSDLDMWRLQP